MLKDDFVNINGEFLLRVDVLCDIAVQVKWIVSCHLKHLFTKKKRPNNI